MRARLRPLAALALTAIALLATACTPAADPAPTTSADAASAGIVIGDGPVAVELWTDPSCPHCAVLDEAIGADLASRIQAGEVTLTIHPMTYVSAKRGDTTDYSTRAAALLFAAAGEPDAIPALYALIQANQVSDAGAPTDAELIAFAAQAGVTGDVSGFAASADLATAANDVWLGQAVPGTDATVDHVPLLVVGGALFDVREDGTDAARFTEAVSAR